MKIVLPSTQIPWDEYSGIIKELPLVFRKNSFAFQNNFLQSLAINIFLEKNSSGTYILSSIFKIDSYSLQNKLR